MELFELFFDNEVYDLMQRETEKYAATKGNNGFSVSQSELKCFIGIMLLSGYMRVPRWRMFWEVFQKIKYMLRPYLIFGRI